MTKPHKPKYQKIIEGTHLRYEESTQTNVYDSLERHPFNIWKSLSNQCMQQPWAPIEANWKNKNPLQQGINIVQPDVSKW